MFNILKSNKQRKWLWNKLAEQKEIFDNFQEELENKAKKDRELYFGRKENLVLITEIFEKPKDSDGQFVLLGEPIVILANGIPI